MDKYLVEIKNDFRIQKLYRFENNYGASVVKHGFSYGHERDLWELAVILWDGDEWHLNYNTPITDDVIGDLTLADVDRILKKIKKLK